MGASRPSRASGPRWGLVLGGGGLLGAAWMAGALTAFEEVHGLDARDAELLVGTSAGAVMAALIGAGVSVDEIRERQLDPRTVPAVERNAARVPHAEVHAPARRGRFVASNARRLRTFPPTTVLAAFAPDGRRSIAGVGRLVDQVVEPGEWAPHPGVRVVALDSGTGRRAVFGDPGAPPAGLSEAVMASCAIPGWFTPVEIGGRRYVDGGTWSATNIDLVLGRGLDVVYVLAPMASFAVDEPAAWPAKLERVWRERVTRRALREIARVHRDGTEVTMIGPGVADLRAIGGNLMDASRTRTVLETALSTSRAALADPSPLPERRAG